MHLSVPKSSDEKKHEFDEIPPSFAEMADNSVESSTRFFF